MLAFEVTLLTGRYVATAYNDRNAAEWPPHPARLFSALVAVHFESLDPPEDERTALQWLEQQGAPEITAPEESARDVVTVFVPVNDTSVVASLEAENAAVEEAHAELAAAREKGGKAVSPAEKKVAKAEEKRREATRKAVSAVAPGKEGKEGPREAESLLPERRKKQPRTFPSVTPADTSAEPKVVFAWPAAEPTPGVRESLDRLAGRVARLGHSSSFVSVRVTAEQSAPTWIPDDTGRGGGEGRVLRVVGPGQLAGLCAAYAQPSQREASGRVMPALFQRYVVPGAPAKATAPVSVFGDEWTVLRRVQGPKDKPSPRLPSVRAVDVATTLRKALMAAYGPGAPEILSGHRASGEAANRPHLAYVPLPFVGHERADGSILGVALVFPRDATVKDKQAVHAALAAWEKHNGEGDDDELRVPVHMGKAGDFWLTRLEEDAVQSTLRAETWCAEARSWASATPVALDRNPGDLGSSDPKREATAYAEAEASVALSCERIGLPKPARVTVVPAAPLAGGDKARHFGAFSTGTPPVRRVLVHATLVFDAPVRGPILLGAGRYFGLGLFRPVAPVGEQR